MVCGPALKVPQRVISLHLLIKLHEHLGPQQHRVVGSQIEFESLRTRQQQRVGVDGGTCHRQSRLIIFFSLHDMGLSLGLTVSVLGPMVILATMLALVSLWSRPTAGLCLVRVAR
jgi:hypothetical protein